MRKIIIVLFVICQSAMGSLYAADNSMQSNTLDLTNLPKKVLLIDPEIAVKELSVGGVAEKVDDWSKQAKQNVLNALNLQISSNHVFEKLEPPKDLPPEEATMLDEHVALYDVVGFNAFYFGRSQFDAWKHKKQAFDYTLGNGLKALAEKTGADAALFVIGEDYISSGGRKATRIFAALLGVVLPPSPTFLSVGLVDLKTGNVLWMNYALAADSKDLRKSEDAVKMIEEMFLHYPGRGNGKGA